MDEPKIAELEAQIRATTDQVGKLMDLILQKGFVLAFACSHSGLLLPGNYVKDWGRDGIGIGLGPHPVSEILDSDYDTPPAGIKGDMRRAEQVMHPIGYCFAQVDRVMVPPAEYSSKMAVLDRDDPDMLQRVKIIREKQLANPRSQLREFYAAWERAR